MTLAERSALKMTDPKLARTTDSGDRTYMHVQTHEVVPSVTTIIKNGIPKPALMPWAAKMAAEHADANWYRLSKLPPAERVQEIKSAYKVYTEKAANLGTLVHKLIECWSTGQPYPEWDKDVEKFVDQFINFMTTIRPQFIESEVTVWSRTYGYAGTADFIALIDGKTVLGDVKTGRNLYPEVGLQLSALANADFIIREDGTEEEIPTIDRMAALHVRPRSWNLNYVAKTDECFECFLAAKAVMEWQRKTAPHVLR
jgi:hypothetical protein